MSLLASECDDEVFTELRSQLKSALSFSSGDPRLSYCRRTSAAEPTPNILLRSRSDIESLFGGPAKMEVVDAPESLEAAMSAGAEEAQEAPPTQTAKTMPFKGKWQGTRTRWIPGAFSPLPHRSTNTAPSSESSERSPWPPASLACEQDAASSAETLTAEPAPSPSSLRFSGSLQRHSSILKTSSSCSFSDQSLKARSVTFKDADQVWAIPRRSARARCRSTVLRARTALKNWSGVWSV